MTLSMSTAWSVEAAVMSMVPHVKAAWHDVAWQDTDEESLWRELAFCILSSNVKYECAYAYATHLHHRGLLERGVFQRSPGSLQSLIADALSEPSAVEEPAYQWHGSRYRFPSVRAAHISQTMTAVWGDGGSLKALLAACSNPMDARRRLMLSAAGVGPKQSSLFLRNIGYAIDLAVLDTHVLRFMAVTGILAPPIRKPRTLPEYENLENHLRLYAREHKVRLSYLDVAIWVMMRVWHKEFAR